jgi:hypothetical protein
MLERRAFGGSLRVSLACVGLVCFCSCAMTWFWMARK